MKNIKLELFSFIKHDININDKDITLFRIEYNEKRLILKLPKLVCEKGLIKIKNIYTINLNGLPFDYFDGFLNVCENNDLKPIRNIINQKGVFRISILDNSNIQSKFFDISGEKINKEELLDCRFECIPSILFDNIQWLKDRKQFIVTFRLINCSIVHIGPECGKLTKNANKRK